MSMLATRFGSLRQKFDSLTLTDGIPGGGGFEPPKGVHMERGSSAEDVIAQVALRQSLYESIDSANDTFTRFIGEVAKNPLDYGALKKAAVQADKVLQVDIRKCQESIGDRSAPSDVGSELENMHVLSANLQSWISLYNTKRSQRTNPGPLMKSVFDHLKCVGNAEVASMSRVLSEGSTERDRKTMGHSMGRVLSVICAMQVIEPHGSIIADWETDCKPILDGFIFKREEFSKGIDECKARIDARTFQDRLENHKSDMQFKVTTATMTKESLCDQVSRLIDGAYPDIAGINAALNEAEKSIADVGKELEELASQTIHAPSGEEISHPETAVMLGAFQEQVFEFREEVTRIIHTVNEKILGLQQERIELKNQTLADLVAAFADRIEQGDFLVYKGEGTDIIAARSEAKSLESQLKVLCDEKVEQLRDEPRAHPNAADYLEFTEDRMRSLDLSIGVAERVMRESQFRTAEAAVRQVVDAKLKDLLMEVISFKTTERSLLFQEVGADRSVIGDNYPQACELYASTIGKVDQLHGLFMEATELKIKGPEHEDVELSDKASLVEQADTLHRSMHARASHYENPEEIIASLDKRYQEYLANLAVNAMNPTGVDLSVPSELRTIEEAKYMYVFDLKDAASEAAVKAVEADLGAEADEWYVVKK